MLIKADIHIHTCLSPCADIRQSPKGVVEKARAKGLNLIFITDHNTMENAEAAMKTGAQYDGLKVYPGLEITSREEVHLLALFEKLENASRVQKYIYRDLPNALNEKEHENQIIANDNDEVVGYLKKSLFSSVDMSLERIIDLIHDNVGIAVAAHIDRESFSVISQLGFIPENLSFDALEISPNMNFEQAKHKYPDYFQKYCLLKGSDSHSLDMIGTSYTEFEAEDNSFRSLRKFINERPVITYS